MMWNEKEGAASHYSAPDPSLPDVTTEASSTNLNGTPVQKQAVHWEEHECWPVRVNALGTVLRCARCGQEFGMLGEQEHFPAARCVNVWTVAGDPMRGGRKRPHSRWITRCHRRLASWAGVPLAHTVFTLLQSSHQLLFYRGRAASSKAPDQPSAKGGE